MEVRLDIRRDVIFQIPFNLSLEELVLDKDEDLNANLQHELDWLADNATEDELPRIMTCALILNKVKGYPMAACIKTAIVWERG